MEMPPQRLRFAINALTAVLAVSACPIGELVAQVPGWRFVPTDTIGRFGSDVVFEAIDDVSTASDGRVFVADSRARQILVLDPRGQRTRTIGREGAGPGEFRSVRHLTVFQGRLHAYDGVLRRLSVFDSTGGLLRSYGPVPLPEGAGLSEAPPQRVLEGGALLVLGLPLQAGPGAVANLYVRDARAEQTRAFARLYWGESSRRIRTSRFGATFKQPVDEISLWDVTPDGSTIVILDRPIPAGDVATAELTVITAGGDTIRTVPLRLKAERIPREVAEREMREVAEEYSRSLRSLAIPPSELYDAFSEHMAVPSHQSPFDRFLIGSDDTLWLREGAFGRETARWRILSIEGEPLGWVEISSEYEIREADRERFWAAARGEFDEPVLLRFDRVR